MTHRTHMQLFGLLALTLPLAACAQNDVPVAPAAQVAATRPASPPPQLVSGLPDFTQLVDPFGSRHRQLHLHLGDGRRKPDFRRYGPHSDECFEIDSHK